MSRRPLCISLCTLSLLALLLTACGGSTSPTPDALSTQSAQAQVVAAAPTAAAPTATLTPTPVPTHTDTPAPTPTDTTAPTSTSTPTLTQTPTVTPTSTSTSTSTPTPTARPPTRTPKPPTPTTIPLLPTPADWTAVDWTEIARIILRGAMVYRPQMVEVKALLGQDPTNCARLAYLLDNLANAPRYREVANLLWEWRGRPGLEGELWSYLDAYGDVNMFRLDTFRVLSDACAAGTQPTAEQREAALHWMIEVADPIAKMDHVINRLDPEVGP